MRTYLLVICSLLFPGLLWAGTKDDSNLRFNRKPMTISFDKKIKFDLVASFDFSRFITDDTHRMFDTKYSNELSSSMFGKSVTIYLGEKLKLPADSKSGTSRFMYITQLKVPISDETAAKKYLERKPGYKNQQIQIKTNKNGLKMAVANYFYEKSESYYYLLVLGTPSLLFTEANMLDHDSIAIE